MGLIKAALGAIGGNLGDDSADGTLYPSDKLNELSKAADSPLKLLQSVQYNHLVDRNNRVQAFFD